MVNFFLVWRKDSKTPLVRQVMKALGMQQAKQRHTPAIRVLPSEVAQPHSYRSHAYGYLFIRGVDKAA